MRRAEGLHDPAPGPLQGHPQRDGAEPDTAGGFCAGKRFGSGFLNRPPAVPKEGIPHPLQRKSRVLVPLNQRKFFSLPHSQATASDYLVSLEPLPSLPPSGLAPNHSAVDDRRHERRPQFAP